MNISTCTTVSSMISLSRSNISGESSLAATSRTKMQKTSSGAVIVGEKRRFSASGAGVFPVSSDGMTGAVASPGSDVRGAFSAPS